MLCVVAKLVHVVCTVKEPEIVAIGDANMYRGAIIQKDQGLAQRVASICVCTLVGSDICSEGTKRWIL